MELCGAYVGIAGVLVKTGDRFEVHMIITMKNAVFWDVLSYSLVEVS
jgi:hypothetical protein